MVISDDEFHSETITLTRNFTHQDLTTHSAIEKPRIPNLGSLYFLL